MSACFCLETFPIPSGVRIVLVGDNLILLVTLLPLRVRLTLDRSNVGLIVEIVISFVSFKMVNFGGFLIPPS